MIPRALRVPIVAALCAVLVVPATAADLRRANLRALVLRDPAVSSQNRLLVRDYAGPRGGIATPAVSFGDLTGDGRADVVVPIYSGGTAGIIAYFVYAEVDGRVRDVRAVNETYKAGVAIRDGRLVESIPRYRATDANCCPTHRTTTVLRWNGDRLVVQARTTKRSLRPSTAGGGLAGAP